MNDEVKAYRIVEELPNGKFKTLFHGIGGSRLLEVGKWYEAERKWVRDGGGQELYQSGFNVLLELHRCMDYVSRFRAPRTLRLARCTVSGLRQKPTNEHVMLADRLRIDAILESHETR